MLLCMRTTITLDNSIFLDAKQHAAERHVTLSRFIEDAVRVRLLEMGEGQREAGPFELITVRGRSIQDSIDLDRTSSLIEADDIDAYRKNAG